MRVPVHWANAPFPYLPTSPEGACELCHRGDEPIVPIVIESARRIVIRGNKGPRRGWRAARVIYVCRRHAGGNGQPVPTPNTITLRGTSALRPQHERLFDSIPYSRRAGRFG